MTSLLLKKNMQLKNNSICPICSGQISNTKTPYNDIGWTDFKIFKKLEIVHCTSCGFGFSTPELDEKLVNNFYSDQYRGKESTFHINFSKLKGNLGVKDIRNSRAFGQLYLARSFCKFNKQDIFLNIGPGVGGSFNVANILLNNPNLRAIELSRGAKEFYKDFYCAESHNSINDFVSSNLEAQIIIMSHSLEHYRLSDLSELLSNLSLALAKNGVAVIEVPHVDLRIHEKNRGTDTPHFLFFSLESIKKLFEKNSFEILFIDTCGQYYSTFKDPSSLDNKSLKLKRNLKQGFNNLPKSYQIILRSMLRIFEKVKTFRLVQKINTTYSLPQLSYGENRQAIRMVIRNKKSIDDH